MPMNTIRNLYQKSYRFLTRKLANKLILIFSFTVSLFIIALIFISYNRTTDTLIKDFIDNNKSILKLVNQNFENDIEQIDEFSLTPRQDAQLMTRLTLEEDDYDSEKYIETQLRNMFYSRKDIEEIRFYIPSSMNVYYISRSNANIGVDRRVDIRKEPWYQKATEGKYFRHIDPKLGSKADKQDLKEEKIFFTFYRALINIQDQQPLGMVSISFNNTLLKKTIKDEYLENGAIMCILDKENNLFYFNSPVLEKNQAIQELLNGIKENAGTGNFKIRINKFDYLTVFDVSENSGWKMIKLIPLDAISEKIRETRDLSLFAGVIFVFLLIVLIMLVSNAITVPLKRLSRQMDKVGGGNFAVQAEIKGNDEIARLAQKFNSMVTQINDLVNENYLAEINEKTARLKALEAQINPHFLYNSLQAIATKAVMGGMKDISKMIEALAYNLRYCIKEEELVTVSKEMKHINNYLILHKARFDDRLTVEISVQEGTGDVQIPKLSVHTLVENSIKHGLETMTESILIKIHAYFENEHTIIEVSDDGPGMANERLQQVIRDLEDQNWLDKANESIGLKNLNARLKLMYGNEANIDITSGPGLGTVMKMILPQNNQGTDKAANA
ncbi:MAG: sensor histidine kinase [Clostridia bacterium]|nr:sensor histidine kinase [Clostridia bacterium]